MQKKVLRVPVRGQRAWSLLWRFRHQNRLCTLLPFRHTSLRHLTCLSVAKLHKYYVLLWLFYCDGFCKHKNGIEPRKMVLHKHISLTVCDYNKCVTKRKLWWLWSVWLEWMGSTPRDLIFPGELVRRQRRWHRR